MSNRHGVISTKSVHVQLFDYLQQHIHCEISSVICTTQLHTILCIKQMPINLKRWCKPSHPIAHSLWNDLSQCQTWFESRALCYIWVESVVVSRPFFTDFQYSFLKKTNTSTLLQIAILSGDDGQITTLWMHHYYSHSPNPILFIFCAFQLIKIGLSSISAQL